MKSERWIELSRRVYARLLKLYPSGHRNEYGPAMLQLFTDQCRAAWEARRGPGLAGLWLRSLVDLGVSVLREQLAAPGMSAGLLEAVPNAPLPWKGVALVVLPSLAFAVGQIVQLTGQDWFFLMVYRAGYFLILPVLVVWVWKRKFPVWGLIPLGVLANTLVDLASRFQNGALSSTHPIVTWLEHVLAMHSTAERIVLVGGVFLCVAVLVGLEVRRKNFPPLAWLWLGFYFVLTPLRVIAGYWSFVVIPDIPHLFNQVMAFYLVSYGPAVFINEVGLLLVVLLGTLLARRHGRLAILLPLGYVLPTVLYGRFGDWWSDPAYLFLVSAAVLAFRLLLGVVAPVWIARSASQRGKVRAATITLLVGVGIEFALRTLINYWMSGAGFKSLIEFFAFSDPFITALGIALALCLYRDPIPIAPVPQREGAAVEVPSS